MAEHQIPGVSIAVTSSSGPLYTGAYGHADLAEHRPTTTDTRFLWFSMSKIVTATAALRLADEGRLDLDAPVRSVVPTFSAKAGHTQPRIRQLLNHTAGRRTRCRCAGCSRPVGLPAQLGTRWKPYCGAPVRPGRWVNSPVIRIWAIWCSPT